jgi:hypothetical protein
MAEGGNQNMVSGGGDILTVQKNGVIAINNLDKDIQSILAQITVIAGGVYQTIGKITSGTVVGAATHQEVVGSGRLTAISIPIHSGSNQVYVYDCASVAAQANTNMIFASLPSNASSFTPYQTVNLKYTLGLSIKADASTSLVVAYTPD